MKTRFLLEASLVLPALAPFAFRPIVAASSEPVEADKAVVVPNNKDEMFHNAIPDAKSAFNFRGDCEPSRAHLGLDRELMRLWHFMNDEKTKGNDDDHERRLLPVEDCVRCITIDTVFHMIYNDEGVGGLTEAEIDTQMDVLNTGFYDTPFQFHLINVTRHNSTFLSEGGIDVMLINRFEEGVSQVRSIRQGDYTTMNVYWVNALLSGPPALASHPSVTRNGVFDFVIIERSHRPGGGSQFGFPIEGKALVHEAGHWLGLLHPFSDDCDPPFHGDHVADTPIVSAPGRGSCLAPPDVTIDTCPNQPGLDLRDNFMDYSIEHCMKRFTVGQIARMYAQWFVYRSEHESCRGDDEMRLVVSVRCPPPNQDDPPIQEGGGGEDEGLPTFLRPRDLVWILNHPVVEQEEDGNGDGGDGDAQNEVASLVILGLFCEDDTITETSSPFVVDICLPVATYELVTHNFVPITTEQPFLTYTVAIDSVEVLRFPNDDDSNDQEDEDNEEEDEEEEAGGGTPYHDDDPTTIELISPPVCRPMFFPCRDDTPDDEIDLPFWRVIGGATATTTSRRPWSRWWRWWRRGRQYAQICVVRESGKTDHEGGMTSPMTTIRQNQQKARCKPVRATSRILADHPSSYCGPCLPHYG